MKQTVTDFALGEPVPTVDWMEAPTVENPELRRALRAVNYLNSYVRSEACRRHLLSKPERAIYHLKRYALEAAQKAGMVSHRRVGVVATCRDCGGTGRYMDSVGQEFDHCHRCQNRGHLVLYFVESEILFDPSGWQFWKNFAWHTPEKQWPREWNDWLKNEFPGDTRWKTHQLGQDLTPAQVAECLNVAEAYFPQRPPLRWVDLDYTHRQVDDFDYRLYVGETSKCCRFCGSESEESEIGRCAVRRGNICWIDHACKACRDRYPVVRFFKPGAPKEPNIYDDFPWPHQLTNNEHIQGWIERHPAKELTKEP